MSLAATARAVPTLLRVGFSEAVAYRAELLVWVLSTTMPLIMLALWSAVARDAPVGRFDQPEFVAYFLATFIVRQLSGSWIAWLMNYEVRQGTLSMRLLRPMPVPLAYACEALSALPMRLCISLPVAAIALALVGAGRLPRGATAWTLWFAALAGSWMITFLAGFCIGCLAFFLDSANRAMDAWLALFYVFSGYLVPIELFPPAIRNVAEVLPWRFQIGLPVELLTSAHEVPRALELLALQGLWVLAFALLAGILWHRGLARFAAFGG